MIDRFEIARKHGAAVFLLAEFFVETLAGAGSAEVSYSRMVEATGMARPTVSKALAVLEAVGFIAVTRKFKSMSTYKLSGKEIEPDSDKSGKEIELMYSTTTSLINLNNSSTVHKLNQIDEEQTGEITQFQVLSDAFTNTTGIQFYDPPRWIDAVNFMLRQNVTPDDIETSFREIKDKYPVHGPWSLQKSALQVKTKRNGNGRGPKIDPRNIPVEEY